MSTSTRSTAEDVTVSDRLQPIHVSSEYLGKYKSAVSIRDLPVSYLDEPKDLGGDNEGPTPLESVLASLCGCTAMIVHIMQREMRFELESLHCEADGVTDVRRVEMKRSGLRYSEVEPLSYHFYQVEQRIFIKTSESDERLDVLKAQVARLCPVSRLLEDAGVTFNVAWVRD